MTKWILFISSMILSCGLSAQGFTYSYLDPCTKTYKSITIPQSQQGITVNYYGNINTFNTNDFSNGNFDLWITQVSQANSSSPCDEITASIQTNTNQIITQNIVSTLTNITSATATVSQTLSGGMSSSLGNATNNSSENSRGGKKGNKSNNSSNNGNSNNNSSSGNISSSSSSQNGNSQSTTTGGNNQGNGGSNNSQGETNNQNGGNTGNSTNTTQNGGGTTQPSVNTGGNNGSTSNTGGNNGGNGSTTNSNGNGRNSSNGGNSGEVNTNNQGNTDNTTTEGTTGGGGGTTNSISNAAENTEGGNGGGKSDSKTRVGSLIGTGDIVVIRNTDVESPDQLKATMSFTKTNTNNTRAKGLLGNFTTSINNSNLTLYTAYTTKKNTLIFANSSMIDFQRNFFNTTTAMESYRFGRLSLMGGANYTIGGVGKGSFQNLSAVGGAFYLANISKKVQVTTLVLAVYSPYTVFYEGKWWESSTLIVPFSSWDYSITKTFKFNVSFAGTYEVNANFLNYQILTGGKILFY